MIRSRFTQSVTETTWIMRTLALKEGRQRYLPNYGKVHRAIVSGIVPSEKDGRKRRIDPNDNPRIAEWFDLKWDPTLDIEAIRAAAKLSIAG